MKRIIAPMRALSIMQPWGARIVSGQKTIEIRRRRIALGPLLLHASQKMHVDAEPGDETLPRGVLLALVDVVECRPATVDDAAASMCGEELFEENDDLIAIVLANVRPVAPDRVRGWPYVFPVPNYKIL